MYVLHTPKPHLQFGKLLYLKPNQTTAATAATTTTTTKQKQKEKETNKNADVFTDFNNCNNYRLHVIARIILYSFIYKSRYLVKVHVIE